MVKSIASGQSPYDYPYKPSEEEPVPSLKNYIFLARPHHYIKNGFVLVPIFFAHKITELALLIPSIYAFAGFCVAASTVYVFNDLIDIDKDRRHPEKCRRPLAAGHISRNGAYWLLALLLLLTILANLLIANRMYSCLIIFYILLNIFYSFKLQQLVMIDGLCVAAGFVLRVFAGAVVINVPVSGWLAGLTFLLALFVSLAKRRCDAIVVGNGDKKNISYNPQFLSIAVIILAVLTSTGYLAYTLSPAIIAEHQAPNLYWTSVWVILGIFRYTKIVFSPEHDCSPVAVLLRDVYLQGFVLGWLFSLWAILYTDVI